MPKGEMNWEPAIRKVLNDATEPLHYADIANIIAEKGYRKNLGATPQYTANARLNRMRTDGEVKALGDGLYVLSSIADEIADRKEKEAEAEEKDAADDSKLAVRAYGLYWKRSGVDWNGRKLLGQQGKGSLVDFADQVGIYLLHNWNEIVYVGQTSPPKKKGSDGLYNRLKNHNDSPEKSNRWGHFSWFGFKAVGESDGELRDAPSTGELDQVIDVIEGLLIEALMPRLNMRSGDGMKKVRKDGLYNQVEVRQLSGGSR